ncbi:MAG TPA: PorV/PorQ family protein [bacterium]|nr:PorV/PorQ family protein [bacterium]
MKKIKILFLALTLLTVPLFSGSGESGLAFLNLPPSAGCGGVMNVFASSKGSPASIFRSPLGISDKNSRIAFSHNMWFADVRSEVLAISFPTKYGKFAIGGNLVRIPGIEVRTTPTDQPLQEIEGQYFSGNLTYNKEIVSSIQLGATVKYLYEYAYNQSANGMAADIGMIWRSPADLDISLQLLNIGKMQDLDQSSTRLPRTFMVGIMRPEILNGGPLSVALGFNLKTDLVAKETGAQFGGEATLYNTFFIRGGYEHFGDVAKKSAGLGLNYKQFTIDYAIIMMDNGLSNPKLLSIGYRF